MLKKNSDLVVSLEWTCPSLGLEVMTFYVVECCLVLWSYPQIHVSSPVIIFKRNSGSYCSLFWRFWQLPTQFSCPRHAEDKFDVIPLHVLFSWRVVWSDPSENSSILAASCVMVLLLSRTVPLLIYIFVCFYIYQCLKLSASSTEVTPLLNLRNHPRTCTLHLFFSTKSIFSFLRVSVSFFSSLKQYLMMIWCYFKSLIL